MQFMHQEINNKNDCPVFKNRMYMWSIIAQTHMDFQRTLQFIDHSLISKSSMFYIIFCKGSEIKWWMKWLASIWKFALSTSELTHTSSSHPGSQESPSVLYELYPPSSPFSRILHKHGWEFMTSRIGNQIAWATWLFERSIARTANKNKKTMTFSAKWPISRLFWMYWHTVEANYTRNLCVWPNVSGESCQTTLGFSW